MDDNLVTESALTVSRQSKASKSCVTAASSQSNKILSMYYVCKFFDQLILNTLIKMCKLSCPIIANMDVEQCNSLLQAALPVKLGGLGLKSTTRLCVANFLTSISSCFESEFLSPIFKSYINSGPNRMSPISEAIHNSLQRVFELIKIGTQEENIENYINLFQFKKPIRSQTIDDKEYSISSFFSSFTPSTGNSIGLQAAITNSIHLSQKKILHDKYPAESEEKARLLAGIAKGASFAFTAIPTHNVEFHSGNCCKITISR